MATRLKSFLALLILISVSIVFVVTFNPRQTNKPFQKYNKFQNDTKYIKNFSDLKLIFGMVVRDRDSSIHYSSQNIESLAMRAASSTVIVIENDSRDRTIDVLKEWDKKVKENPRFHIKEIDIRSFVWNRAYKDLTILARARNELLSVIKTEKYQGYDWALMVDSDMCSQWDINNMEKVLSTLIPYEGELWDAIFVNGARDWSDDGWPDHYDRFAYRDKNVVWDPHNEHIYNAGFGKRLNPVMQLWFENSHINPFNCLPLPGKFDKFDCNMLQGHPLINVHSAFGGIGIYSTKIIYPGGCEYVSDRDCEHVVFNNCLREKFNASLVVSGRIVVDWDKKYCSGDFRESEKVKNLFKKAPLI